MLGKRQHVSWSVDLKLCTFRKSRCHSFYRHVNMNIICEVCIICICKLSFQKNIICININICVEREREDHKEKKTDRKKEQKNKRKTKRKEKTEKEGKKRKEQKRPCTNLIPRLENVTKTALSSPYAGIAELFLPLFLALHGFFSCCWTWPNFQEKKSERN